MSHKAVLDVCCGSKMFWFDKRNDRTVYMDNRQIDMYLNDNRRLIIEPDVVGDFRNIPFSESTFNLVVFDPPHLLRAGKDSWLSHKYGVLSENWREDIAQGFKECFRVLKPDGILVFKWNEEQVKLTEILKCCHSTPLFGNQKGNTHWLVYIK